MAKSPDIAVSARAVTVAYKGPSGLLLRLFKMVSRPEPVMGGGSRDTLVAEQVGEIVRINGNATPHGMAPRCEIVGGYALTHDVPADFMAEWLKQNAEHDAVRNGLLIVHGTVANVTAQAKEQRSTSSGLQPLDVSETTEKDRTRLSDKRVGPRTNPALSNIAASSREDAA